MTVLSPILRFSLPVLLGLTNLVVLGSHPVSGTELEQGVPVALPSSAESSALASLASLQAHTKESSPSDAELELLRRLQEYNSVGKRAYSYVSEYKRLPVYNFGLGKRSKSQLYSFGLGKRSPGGRTYSFGLGKRAEDFDDGESLSDDQDDDDEDVEEIGEDNEIDTLSSEDEMMEKRNKLYSFGLGKRTKPYGFGLGKRYPGDAQRLYSFGLGKRGRPEMYSFGLGKRGDANRLYSFGLGKRPSHNQNSRFNFGLGKRSYDDEDSDGSMENAKRTLADRRFGFGLGKREVSETDLKEVGDETKQGESKTQEHVIGKRSLHYGFGLGKRSKFDGVAGQEEAPKSQGDMMRFARRPYSFGLGKRAPLYDFGIGKRSDG